MNYISPELNELLQTPAKSVIIPHVRPDGDAIGSSVGLAILLAGLNHKANILSPSPLPPDFLFIEGAEDIVDASQHPEQAARLVKDAEIIWVLDCGALDRIEILGPWVASSDARIVNIDHHPEPSLFAHLYLHDAKAGSTCELVYRMLEAAKLLPNITPACATALYLGIVTDTGSFSYPSVSSRLHRQVADLIDRGAEFAKIHHALNSQSNPERLRLLGYALNEGLRILPKLRTAYMVLPRERFRQLGLAEGAAEGFVNHCLTVKGINLAAILVEEAEHIKMSFRSVGSFPANELAKHFGGGGHHNAAGGRSMRGLADTETEFLRILHSFEAALQYDPFGY